MVRDPRRVEVHPVCHERGCRSYVVVAPETGDAAVIDPLLDKVSETNDLIHQHGAQLRYIFETHSHGDHLSGARVMHERTGAEVVAHPQNPITFATMRPGDAQRLTFGEHGLTVHHAPGLTNDAIVIEGAGCFFTGDTLLIGTVGIADAPGRDPAAWFETLDRLFGEQPDETMLHPGNDDMGRTYTTLRQERTGNLWLRTDDLDTFVRMVHADDRAARKDAERVLELNGEGLTAVPKDMDAASGLTPPAALAEKRAASLRRHEAPESASAAASEGQTLILFFGGLLCAAGTIGGWMFNPVLHALSLVAAVLLLGASLPTFDRRRKRARSATLYYEGPAETGPRASAL